LEFALCLTGLVAAGTLGRSLANLKAVDLGFDRQHLAYVSVSPARAGYPRDSLGSYAQRVREEIAKVPGVLRVSTVAFRPLSGMGNNGRVNLPGQPWSDAHRANLNRAGVGFFETAGIPLRAGRTFETRDMRPRAGTAVVDEAFATRYFPKQNPLGRRFGLDPANNHAYEIVGVVGNSLYNNLRDIPYPTVYEPYQPGDTIRFALRMASNPAHFAEAVRKALAAVDPAVPMTEFRTQSQLIDRMLRTERLLVFVSSAFGLIALLLAAVGLGGLLAYVVASRTREIGVRMALGARSGNILRMVLWDSLWMVGGGALLGVPGVCGVGAILKNTLFRLQAVDTWSVVFSISALLAVALLAGSVPALRAAKIDPVSTLRDG
jgi:predicted permease